MLFTEEFISALKDDPVSGTIDLCNRTFSSLEEHEGWDASDFEILAEAYSLLLEVIEAQLLPIAIFSPSLSGNISSDCSAIYKYLTDVHEICSTEATKLRMDSMRARFRISLGSGFAYEFSQGDLDRVQSLLNQLRELIQNATHFDKQHQQRLLRRLEKLQSEMHKKVSDLDRFWGLIGDAGVVIGKFGNDAKPIVDRIKEIADIVWQTQSRAEELPSGTRLPSLEHKPRNDGEAI